jgi:hypothetical protein
MEQRQIEPLQHEIGRKRRRGDVRQERDHAGEQAPGSIASGPASTPAMTASRLLVRCLITGRITTAPIRL